MTLANMKSVYCDVNNKDVSSCFSRYSVGISTGAKDVEQAIQRVVINASAQGSRERRRADIRYANPHGNAFAICHCSSDPQRLVLLASIVEVMWIHDDVTEELSHRQACDEHEILAKVIHMDIEPRSLQAQNNRQATLASVLQRAISCDLSLAPKMISTLTHYLESFDSREDDFDRMEEYLQYRIANCGYWISSFFIRWGMGFDLTEDDYESIRDYDHAMGNVLGLTNDYFSWDVEKNQPTDRVRNGVRVLMKEHDVSAQTAKTLLLGFIVQEETRAANLKRVRLLKPVSKELNLYFEAIELYVGGSCYWHATAPRYMQYE